MENIEINILQNTEQKKQRGRPKNGFNKVQYDKEYREEHKDQYKEYHKLYTQKILSEKGTSYNKIKENAKKYNQQANKALKFIKEIKDNPFLHEDFKSKINDILN